MTQQKPTTDLLKIEAEDDKTHALLCAVLRARRKAEETGYMDHYLDEFEEWEEALREVHFADRD